MLFPRLLLIAKNPVRGHRTGSNNSGVEEYLRQKKKKIRNITEAHLTPQTIHSDCLLSHAEWVVLCRILALAHETRVVCGKFPP